MLRERRIASVSYDQASDTLSIHIDGAVDVPSRGVLLLSAARALVGVDLRDDAGRGEVLMLGAHEEVDTTQEAPLAGPPLRVENASRYLRVK